MKLIPNKQATDVISHEVTPSEVDTNSARFSRLGWLIVLLGVGGFFLWALFAPLDKGVPLQGAVTKESNRKTVQHLTGGTVQEILVHEGDAVKAGQVLVRMNSVQAKSQADVSRVQLFAARAALARLAAERDGKAVIAFPPELLEKKSDPRVAGAMQAQQELFTSRHLSLESELGALEENIAGLRLQGKGLEESRESKKQQLAILKQQLDDMRDLAKDGYVARNRLLDVERTYAQMAGAISEDNGNIGRINRQIAELQLRRSQRMQDMQKEVRTQISESEKEADALKARIEAQDFEVANTDVKAPVDGVVVGMNIFTNGGVVSPGFRMMDLVPINDPLIVEGQLPVTLIDKVHAGLPVELIFAAFNTNTTPHIPGEITQVAADRTIDEKTGTPFYKVRARVTPAGLKLIAAKHMDIRPGMPVELFVKTGERTMMSYLLKPIFDRAKTSMSED